MTGRSVRLWNREWRFALGNYAGAEKPGFPDDGWRELSVPHDWSIEQAFDPYMPGGGFQASLPRWTVGWYRKHFEVPTEDRGKRIYLQFDGVHHNSEVWVNGCFVGKHPYGYVSFCYELTPYLQDGENVLAVKVDNTPMPADRWYSGSGIYRKVQWVAVNPLHVAEWGTFITTPRITKVAAEVHARITLRNQGERAAECRVVTELIDPAGELRDTLESVVLVQQGETVELEQEGKVDHPRLWSIESPSLYKARTRIEWEGSVRDEAETSFGIRDICFDHEKGFFLNGVPTKLKGVCLHHDLGCLGAAYRDEAMERRLITLKEMGVNAIRFAHNPMAPELLDWCDRMGFLVINEAFDKWKSLYYEHLFEEWWERDLESLLLRDRNHPSVILWSVGNEVEKQGQPSMLAILRQLVAFCRKLDPTRPVTCALEPHNTPIHLRDGSIEGKVEHTRGLAAEMDILGLNYQEQWYEAYREAMPSTLLLGTETFPYYRGQGNRVKGYLPLNPWFDVEKHDYVIGQFVWAGIDYLGESVYPSKGWSSGLIDTCGFRKSLSYLQESLWAERKMVRIAVLAENGKPRHTPSWTMHWQAPEMVEHWNHPDYTGRLIRLITFTNCETVELVVNGESYGTRRLADYPDRMIVWHLPYGPGTVKAIGRTGDRIECEHELETAGESVRVRLSADRLTLPANGAAIAHVTAELVDAAGIRVPLEEKEVTFTLSGGEIIGVDNGDLTSDEPYRGCKRAVRGGRCLVVVQAGTIPGSMRLQASLAGLPPAELQFTLSSDEEPG
ncbi:sugar-binding domain-containing protein [Gorillibacterium sp. CAU 1737]|uniref:sugar-binding domain-containing protein n=1 Tax=Gorillibacterium sp. CAU 1737 TaxID=3140362 RepID=UPI003260B126